MRPVYLCFFILPSALVSCVSTGKFKAMQQEAQKNDSLYVWSQRTLKTCQDVNNDLVRQKTTLQNQANDLNQQLTATKENNTQMRKQLRDLSAITSAQAESIKKSLDNMGVRDTYFRDLQSALAHRDAVNLSVLMNLKAYLGNFGDQDVSIKLENGVVHVDLSDRLLFNSDSANSYTLTNKAKTVLSRMARALNDVPGVEFMVEGHTDGIAPHKDSITAHTDGVAVQGDTITVHMDSTGAHADTAVVHMDSAVVHTDTAAVHMDSAVAHIDNVTVPTHMDNVPVHLDTVPVPQSILADNWDLSVKRATSIVRTLQKDYNVAPARMTAAGRSEYITVAPNDTPEGQAANRRTRIIIIPQLDQLLKVLEHRQEQGPGQADPPAPAVPPAVSGS